MVARLIIKWPDKRLKRKSDKINDFEESIISLAKDLADTTKVNYAAGLAAPQIGDSNACCVISCEYVPSLPEDALLPGYVFVANPTTINVSDEVFQWREACLSVEGVSANVKRCDKISVKYQNTQGEFVQAELSGSESATFQHEIDHLEGKLFIDRLGPASKGLVMRKLKKIALNNHRKLSKATKSNRSRVRSRRLKRS